MINTRDPVTGIPQFDGFFVTVRPLRQSEHVHGGADRGGGLRLGSPKPALSCTWHGASSAVPSADQRVDHPAGCAAVIARREVVPGDLQPARGGGDLQLRDRPGRQRPDPHGHRDGPADLLGQRDGSERRRAAGRELTLDQYATPRPLNGTAFQSPYDPTTLPIIIPGPSIISTAALDANGNPIAQQTDGENLALDTEVTGVQVTFDRDMRVGSFVPSDILSLVGPIGPVAGPFTIQVVAGSLRVFNIFFATPQTLSGSYVVTISPNIYSVVNSDTTRTTGDPVDADQNAGLVQLRGGSTANGTTTFTASNNTVTTIGPGQTIQSQINDQQRLHHFLPRHAVAEHHLPDRSGTDGHAAGDRPEQLVQRCHDPPVLPHRGGTEHGELYQHDLLRHRLAADPGCVGAVLRHLPGGDRPGAGRQDGDARLAQRPLGEGDLHPADQQHIVGAHRHGPAQRLVDLDGRSRC